MGTCGRARGADCARMNDCACVASRLRGGGGAPLGSPTSARRRQPTALLRRRVTIMKVGSKRRGKLAPAALESVLLQENPVVSNGKSVGDDFVAGGGVSEANAAGEPVTRYDPVEPRIPHDTEDSGYWVQPPPLDRDGQVPWVDVRFNLNKISAVDTVTSTAFADVELCFYWTDTRLIGWPEDTEPPPKLWGPAMYLDNKLGDIQESGDGFMISDPTTGRVSRAWRYVGTVDNPMDLRNFPFDMDQIDLQFCTLSNWTSFDGERCGQARPHAGRAYRLRQIQRNGEGKWLKMYWSGHIAEWKLHGVSTAITEQPVSASGFEETTMQLGFHVTRKSGYYFWKALLPLYLLTALSMGTFQFDTDNLSDRYNTVMATFLAAFAMLYVVGATLPKTDFLTKIDCVIVLTTVSLAFTGLASVLLAQLHAHAGEDVATRWNLKVVVSLVSAYLFANLWIFLPPCFKKWRGASKLSGYTARQKARGKLPPTIEAGHDYFTLNAIEDGLWL